MSHNTVVIEVLIAVVLLVTIIVAVRILMYGGSDDSAGGAGLSSELESSLKKMMEQVQKTAPAAGDGASASPEELAKYQGEIAELKKQLDGSQKQIEELKQAPAAGAAGGEAAQAQLNQQLLDLQAKLAEYEIISEDIADLSNYKEQNAKLQKEIQELKAGGGSVAAPSAAVEEAVEPVVAEEVAPQVLAEVAVAAEPVPAESVAAEPAKDDVVSDDMMAEFAAAVADQKKVEAGQAAAAPEAPAVPESPAAPAVAEPEAAAVADPSKDGIVDDDLMAEFAAAVVKQKEEESGVVAPSAPSQAAVPSETAVVAAPVAVSEPVADAEPAVAEAETQVDLGAMNIDKVLEEATHIPDVEGVEITAEQALGAGVDENKILQEATALEADGKSTEQPNEDQKLMSQFENFVKKEN